MNSQSIVLVHRRCGDRLLVSPCLLYYFYHNVQWGCWFTYLQMYSYQSLFVPVYEWAVRYSCIPVVCYDTADPVFQPCSPICYRMTRSHVTASVFKLRARFYDTFQVRCCWIKIDSAVNLKRDAKLRVRAVCAVGDTTAKDHWVDLLCCLPHCDTAESCLMNDMLTTFSSSSDCYDDWCWPSSTVCHCPTTPAVRRCRLLRSCYNASAAHLLLAASYIFLTTFLMLQTPFTLLYLLVFP